MATCAMCAAFTTDFLRWEVDKLGVVRWGDTSPTADDVEIRHLVPLASPTGELEWFALHDQGLVEDVTGMYVLGTSAIKANVCEECASVLKAAQKKRSKRKSTRKEAEQHPDVADMVDDEAVDDAEPEEKKENKFAAAPRLPRFLRFRDFGKIPADLPRLTCLERLVLQRVVVFHTTFHVTMTGSRALKGTTIAFPHDGFDRLQVHLSSSGRDLARFVTVVVMTPPGMGSVAKTLVTKHLLLEVEHVRAWAVFLVRHHPSYRQFRIEGNFPAGMVERGAELLDEVKNNICVVQDAIAVGIALQATDDVARQTAHFDPETGNEGTMMWRSVLLRNPTSEAQPDDPAGDLFHGLQERIGTQSSGGADTLPPSPDTPPPSPEPVDEAEHSSGAAAAASSSSDKPSRMNVTVGNDLVSEYDNVAALIQDAFPDLFPCGLTAEMAGEKQISPSW